MAANLKMSNLQLELRMAKMETQNALRSMKICQSEKSEMALEINLVTRSSMEANARAAEGMEVAKSAKTDKAYVDGLRSKVSALQEWAVASSQAKEAIIEQNKMLERKLLEYEKNVDDSDSKSECSSPGDDNKTVERLLWTKASSLVVGAGTLQSREIELGVNKVMDFETVILKWKFDIVPAEDIHFSILKGKVDMKNKKNADAVFRDRVVVGGGGGEVQGAFAIQNACTLVWSNEHSWVRPRAVKYSIQAFAIM